MSLVVTPCALKFFSFKGNGWLVATVSRRAKSFGPGSYAGLNVETGVPFDGWCPQFQLKDLTGLDSIVSPMVSLVLLLLGQALPRIEHRWFNPVSAESIKAGAEATSASSTASA